MLVLAFACGHPEPMDPGRVVLRRLNRAEYDNTVRDLFGTALRPARDFPADDFGLGFDDIGSVLSISPLHVELYDRAADQLLDELFAYGTLPPTDVLLEAESSAFVADNGSVWDVTSWMLVDEGELATPVWIDAASATSGLRSTGDWRIVVDAAGQQAGDEPVRMAIRVDGADVAQFDVPTDEFAPYEVTVALDDGLHDIAVAFTNELRDPLAGIDRNLLVDHLRLTGPLGVPRPPAPGWSTVIPCDPGGSSTSRSADSDAIGEVPCAEEVARTFGRRVLRRPLTADEFAGVMAEYGAVRGLGGDWDEGVRALIKRLLLSPWFVYQVQVDPADGPRDLTGFELASRLSYFLWSSTPDDRLLDLAQSGALTQPDVVEAEARRMLADPRSEALVDNLAGQWLGIRKVESAAPNPDVFPDWDDGLRASLESEAERFVADVLRSDRPIQDLLTSDETWVDARLASFYGVTPPAAEGFAPAVVPDRVGLLSRGGLMAALAYPTRTSPVVRGNWVLSNLLCAPPPPPPGNFMLEDEVAGDPQSLRDQLAEHRANPACAVCHDQMDAYGLALEEYDAMGRYRATDEFGFPIDATGSIEGFGAFDGATEMQAILATDPRFVDCAVEKTFTYALGRGPTAADDLLLTDLWMRFSVSGYRFDELAVAIVGSPAFLRRNGDAPGDDGGAE